MADVAWNPFRGGLSLTAKLWLAFGPLVVIVVVGGAAVNVQFHDIRDDLERLVAVDQRLRDAVLELEISGNEMARSVFKYVRDQDPRRLAKMRDSIADFREYWTQLDRLAESEAKKAISRETIEIFEEISTTAAAIVALIDLRRDAHDRFRETLEGIELEVETIGREALERGRRPSGDGPAAPVADVEMALRLRLAVEDVRVAVESDLARPDPGTRSYLAKAEEAFATASERRRALSLSAAESRRLAELGGRLIEAVALAHGILAHNDELASLLDRFEYLIGAFDAHLHDKVQTAAGSRTTAAAEEARASAFRAGILLAAVIGFAATISAAAAWLIARGIVEPIRGLARSAEIVGAGELGHRALVKSCYEIGKLAATFNRMVENLDQSRRALEGELAERRRIEARLRHAGEAAEAANRAKSEFLSRMSHELRTPMNAVLGFADLLRNLPKEPLSPKQAEYIEYILGAGRHLLNLINDILDLARVEAGKMSFDLARIAVRDVCAECVTLTSPQAAKAGVAVIDETGGRVLPEVLVDRTRTRQALLNLVTNAIKFSGAGGAVRLAAEPIGSAALRLSVADSGPGIPEARHAELFKPFNRLDADAKQIPGTGIGLALTRQLVEKMGGAVGFRSAPGRGATFWLDLPLADKELKELGSESNFLEIRR